MAPAPARARRSARLGGYGPPPPGPPGGGRGPWSRDNRRGGAGREHLVSLDEALECDCENRAYRGVACAHLLACMLAEGDRDCLRSLRYWVPRPGDRKSTRLNSSHSQIS